MTTAYLCLILFILLLFIFLAGVFANHDPLHQYLDTRLTPPGHAHYFGTDHLGRDVFSRTLHGGRHSLTIGSISIIISSVFGIIIGVFSGFHGGILDLILQRTMDVLLAFPFFVLVLIFVVAFGPSSTSLAVAIAIGQVPIIARLSRAHTLVIKNSTYVQAARTIGASDFQIIARHILPNSFNPILAQMPGNFGGAIGAEATLSFFGLGIPPPNPSWGNMMADGLSGFVEIAPWITLFPGSLLVVTVMAFALLSDKLHDFLDTEKRI